MSEQIYYHFLSSKNAIDDLEREMIRISTLDTLNDPFELMPYLRYLDPKKRKSYTNVRNEISKKYGLLCFSDNWHEPLLWSHYADRHRGIAIGFEILKDEIRKVGYPDDPLRKQIDLTANPRINEELFLSLATIKYHKWKYEQEHRILVKLKDCTELDGHHFMQFKDRLKVKEIVLGSKYGRNKEYIQALAGRLGATFIPTRLQWQGYQIVEKGKKAKKLGRIPGQENSGDTILISDHRDNLAEFF